MKNLKPNSQGEIYWGRSNEWLIVLITIFFSGLLFQFPRIFNFDPEFFYPRNISFIIFPMLTIYVSWRNNSSFNNWILPFILFITSAIFINLLPGNDTVDVFVLSCIHLPLFLWSTYGFAFMGKKWKDNNARISFLRYNGDFFVMSGLIGISGFLFTAVTIVLFELIDLKIEEFFINNIVLSFIFTFAYFISIKVNLNSKNISSNCKNIYSFCVFYIAYFFNRNYCFK